MEQHIACYKFKQHTSLLHKFRFLPNQILSPKTVWKPTPPLVLHPSPALKVPSIIQPMFRENLLHAKRGDRNGGRQMRYSPCLQRILGPQREPKNIFRKSLYWYMYKIISNLIFWGIEKSILETMNTEMGSEEWIVFLPVAKSSMVAFSGRRLLWEEA